jgi:outer membrane protein insertion porin family
VLVAEVVINGAQGQLEDEIFRVINTRPGRATTRSQLQADVNAIFATGYFASVDVLPEDTPLGVRVTFVVQANPVLRNVVVNTVPEGVGTPVLPQSVVDNIFSEQYGQILNLRQLQEGIQRLNQWYKENGYDLAQVIDAQQVTADGRVTLVVAEGVVEDIRVRFLE